MHKPATQGAARFEYLSEGVRNRVLSDEDVTQLRHVLHELANIFTGVLVTGGLLQQSLAGDRRQKYAAEVCNGGERGAQLVREARSLLVVDVIEEQQASNAATEGSMCSLEVSASRASK